MSKHAALLARCTLVSVPSGDQWVARYTEVPLCYGLGATIDSALEDLGAIIEPYLDMLVANGGRLPIPQASFAPLPETTKLVGSSLAIGDIFGALESAFGTLTVEALPLELRIEQRVGC